MTYKDLVVNAKTDKYENANEQVRTAFIAGFEDGWEYSWSVQQIKIAEIIDLLERVSDKYGIEDDVLAQACKIASQK